MTKTEMKELEDRLEAALQEIDSLKAAKHWYDEKMTGLENQVENYQELVSLVEDIFVNCPPSEADMVHFHQSRMLEDIMHILKLGPGEIAQRRIVRMRDKAMLEEAQKIVERGES